MLKGKGRYVGTTGEQIKQHPEWFPAPLKASELVTLAGAGGKQPLFKQRPSA